MGIGGESYARRGCEAARDTPAAVRFRTCETNGALQLPACTRYESVR